MIAWTEKNRKTYFLLESTGNLLLKRFPQDETLRTKISTTLKSLRDMGILRGSR